MLGGFFEGSFFSGRDFLTVFYLKVTVGGTEPIIAAKQHSSVSTALSVGLAGAPAWLCLPRSPHQWLLWCWAALQAEAGAGFAHSQVFPSKRWMTASTAASSSTRKAVWRWPALPRMVQTRTRMRRRKPWRTSWGKWSLSWPRPSCSLWRRNVKYR